METQRSRVLAAAMVLSVSWGLFVADATAGEPPGTRAGDDEGGIVFVPDGDVPGPEAPEGGTSPRRRVRPAPRREPARDEPGRDEARRRSDGDELDEARARRDLLEMEVEADKAQLREMLAVLKRTELQALQGFSDGPIIAGGDVGDRHAKLDGYRRKLDEARTAFVEQSKALSRERRRVADLEDRLGLAAARPAPGPRPEAAPPPARRTLDDAQRVADLVLRGIESWQRSTSPTPPPPPAGADRPEDRPLRDADRVLDLIRRGIESWERSNAPEPPPTSTPPPPPPPASPAPPTAKGDRPGDDTLKDAEQILELIRRGVETWQRR